MEDLTKTPAWFARERRLMDAEFDEACIQLGRQEELVAAVLKNQRSVLSKVSDTNLKMANAEADRLRKGQLSFIDEEARTRGALNDLRQETILKSHRAQSDYLTRRSELNEEWARHAVAGGWCAPRPACSGNVIAFPWRERAADDTPMSPALRRRD